MDAFTTNALVPHVERIDYVYNMTELYKPHLNPNLKYYQVPHVFKFEAFNDSDDTRRVRTQYKMWSNSPRWYPQLKECLPVTTVDTPPQQQRAVPRLLAALHEIVSPRGT